jgi:hypothetical protein
MKRRNVDAASVIVTVIVARAAGNNALGSGLVDLPAILGRNPRPERDQKRMTMPRMTT